MKDGSKKDKVSYYIGWGIAYGTFAGGIDMSKIEIREATSDDADLLIACTKRVGGESDNLTFGAEGLPVTTEQEKAFLQSMHDDNHSVFYCAWKMEELVATGSITGLPRRMNHRAELALSVVKAEWNNGIGTLPAFFKIDGEYIDFELMYLDLRQIA